MKRAPASQTKVLYECNAANKQNNTKESSHRTPQHMSLPTPSVYMLTQMVHPPFPPCMQTPVQTCLITEIQAFTDSQPRTNHTQSQPEPEITQFKPDMSECFDTSCVETPSRRRSCLCHTNSPSAGNTHKQRLHMVWEAANRPLFSQALK
jgi:hypothetical protein